MRYYILVKQKSSKKWEGYIPAGKGRSKDYIDKVARLAIRPGWQFKIITESLLINHYLSRMRMDKVKRTKRVMKAKPRTPSRKRKTRYKTKQRKIRPKRRRK